jgi:hypothetical protein
VANLEAADEPSNNETVVLANISERESASGSIATVGRAI